MSLTPFSQHRRAFLAQTGIGLGGIALADLLGQEASAETDRGILGKPHHPPKAKRIIYLFMSGRPSQLDLLDYKPELQRRHGEQLPDSVRGTQRLTGMSGNQSSLPMVGSPFKFKQHGQAGAWFSDLLPHTASIADDLCVVRSMYTEAINHGPGVTFLQTGTQIAGRPSIGAWLSYGLGQENANLPSFVALVTKDKGGQPLGSHLWGSGFLPTKHQGVLFRAARTRCCISATQQAWTVIVGGSCSTACASCTSTSSLARPTPRFAIALSTTKWPSPCSRACQRRQTSRRNPRRCSHRMVPTLPSPAHLPPTAFSRGVWRNGACGSFSFIIRIGIITAICPARFPASAAKPISPPRHS